MAHENRSTIQRYGVAVLATALVMLLRWSLAPALGDQAPLMPFIISVMLGAWYGGLGPGLSATLLGALLSNYLFVAPHFAWNFLKPSDQVHLGLFLAAGILVSGLSEKLHRAGRQAEERFREFQQQRQWNLVTLSSIGDAVIRTDEQGSVNFMNAAAESLTGWSNQEAESQPLEKVFQIVNEQTRLPVENPVQKVLREGTVVGLANHTVLIRKDGQTIPIDDSGAPIRDQNQKIRGVVLVFRDVSERKKAEEVRSQLAAIVESSDDGIIGKTLDGIITSWNAGAGRIYGYSAQEIIGQPIARLVPSNRPDEIQQIMERLRRGERSEHYETIRVRKDGQIINVSVTISPIKNEAGQIIGASTIARDITERTRAEEERTQLLVQAEAAREQAESANRAKDEFLATISHELRTPLTALFGWSRMLRSGMLDEAEQAKALETIERNAQIQAQLIEDLLDISRITAGKLRLDIKEVLLPNIIEEALNVVRPSAQVKGIKLLTHLDPSVGFVSADPDRLQQVIWNLLANAVKFTPKGGLVEVTLQRINSQVEIRVRDNGKGIPREFLPYVFERFRQADSKISRAYGGLGLGLAIVRHLVELHGGTVHVESAGENEGTTFTVRLPLTAVRIDALREEGRLFVPLPKSFQSAIRLDNVRALVVDDEADARDFIRFVLNECKAEVFTAESVAEALEIFKRIQPDILISDIGIPVEDGYALIRKVRQFPPEQGGRIRAIALTAHARAEDRMRVLSEGYQMHVAKPVEPEELIMVVASLLGRTGSIT